MAGGVEEMAGGDEEMASGDEEVEVEEEEGRKRHQSGVFAVGGGDGLFRMWRRRRIQTCSTRDWEHVP